MLMTQEELPMVALAGMNDIHLEDVIIYKWAGVIDRRR